MNEVNVNATPQATQTDGQVEQGSNQENLSPTKGAPGSKANQPTKPKSYVDNDEALFKITVDGEEKEVTAAELKKAYGLDKAAYKKMQQAAQYQRDIEDQVKQWLSGFEPDDPNFRGNMTNFVRGQSEKKGIDVKEVLTEMLVDLAEEESLSPQEKKLRAYEKQESEAKKKEELYRKQQEQADKSALAAQVDEEIDLEIEQAFRESGINNPDAYDIAMMADWMLAGLEGKGQRLSAKAALQKLNTYHQKSVDRWTKRSSAEADDSKFLENVPKDLLDRIRKADLNLTRGKVQTHRPKVQPKQATNEKDRKWMTFDEQMAAKEKNKR